MRVGLVLGAGGIVGQAWHAGTLAGLAAATGWEPDRAEIIVGTSAGSGAGALIRAGIPIADLEARALGRPMSASTTARFEGLPRPGGFPLPKRTTMRPSSLGMAARAMSAPWRFRPGLVAAGMLPAGTADVDMIGAGINSVYGDVRWPDRDLWICAVRLDSGALTVFGREDSPKATVGAAVQASSAIPGWFAPAEIDGAKYVDGGTHSPTNADLLAGSGLDLVFVSSPMSASRGARANPVRLYHRTVLARECARLRRAGTRVVTFQPSAADLGVMGINAMDASRRAAVAESARATVERRLPELSAELEELS